MAPPPMIRGRETTLGGSPSPPSDERLPSEASVLGRSGSPGGTMTMTSASAAPTLVGVAETAPPWYVRDFTC